MHKVKPYNEAMVGNIHSLCKLDHVCTILEEPLKKTIEESEAVICILMKAKNYRTTRDMGFLPEEHLALGIPRVLEGLLH